MSRLQKWSNVKTFKETVLLAYVRENEDGVSLLVPLKENRNLKPHRAVGHATKLQTVCTALIADGQDTDNVNITRLVRRLNLRTGGRFRTPSVYIIDDNTMTETEGQTKWVNIIEDFSKYTTQIEDISNELRRTFNKYPQPK